MFLSGTLCVDEDAHDNIELQTHRIFGRIAGVQAKRGASLSDVVKTTSYLADLADYDGFNRARVETFMDCKEPPASTAIGAGSLLGTAKSVIASRSKLRDNHWGLGERVYSHAYNRSSFPA